MTTRPVLRCCRAGDYGAGTYKYHWHTVADNGLIYSVPDHARYVLEIDPASSTSRQLKDGDYGSGVHSYRHSVLTDEGLIVAVHFPWLQATRTRLEP